LRATDATAIGAGARVAAASVLALAASLVLPPLAGAWVADRPIGPLLQWPPVAEPVVQPPFSWPAFVALAAVAAVLVAPYGVLAARVARLRRDSCAAGGPRRAFPRWGWLGLALVALAWAVAWTRLPILDPLQRHTFTPLWIGYVLVVNAWTETRTGGCLLTRRPRFLLALFPLSAGFWWFFEWLNRFVGNWHYVGVEDFTAWQYVLFASVSFSTVLPAVMSTLDAVQASPVLNRACLGLGRVPLASSPGSGAGLLAAAIAGGFGLARWPEVLFPLLWAAPLLAIVGVEHLFGRRSPFAPIAGGDWRPLLLPPLAALVCGFFWELWNWGSLAHWEYRIPYVQRFHLFEMPVLGYAGYLPFGLECLAAASLLGTGAWSFEVRGRGDRPPPGSH
jgi:hypothetical protein